jgi:hypothetical protein
MPIKEWRTFSSTVFTTIAEVSVRWNAIPLYRRSTGIPGDLLHPVLRTYLPIESRPRVRMLFRLPENVLDTFAIVEE